MAQNITLLGASYSDVPSVELPKTGGGTAQFDDTTIASNAASASDITSGKLAFVNGELVTGTASGGGATLITKSITANGTYNASSDNADGYSSVTVNVSGGGGGGGNMSDPIRFFDYDGTLVASYSSVPASLPSVPTHDKLKNGTWNYTLAQVTTQFNAMGTCDVGANYDTVSGATEIDIELHEGRLHPYLSLAVNGEVSIDWGDNSTPSTSTGGSLTTRKADIHHEYAAAGSYTIKISRTSGNGYALYCTSTYYLLNGNMSTASNNRVYAASVKSVRVGAYCTIGGYAFDYCTSLESISLPSGITSIGQNMCNYCYSIPFVSVPNTVTTMSSSTFAYCYSMGTVSLPSSITTLSNNTFQYAYGLTSVSIPSTVTVLGASSLSNSSIRSVRLPNTTTTLQNYVFSACLNLSSLTVPSSVTTIGNTVFGTCSGMKEYHFLSTTPPTLGTTAFSGIRSDCIIYVPSGSLSDYKAAENWATYADYMVGE